MYTWDSSTKADGAHLNRSLYGYHSFIRVVPLLTAAIIHISALIRIVRQATAAKHHLLVYFIGMLVAGSLENTFGLLQVIMSYWAESDVYTRRTSKLCNVTLLVINSAYRSYFMILLFALLDRILKSLTPPAPTGALVNISKKLCSYRMAILAVCLSYFISSIFANYYLYSPEEGQETTCSQAFLHSTRFGVVGLLFEIFIQVLILISGFALLFLFCLTGRPSSEETSSATRPDNSGSTRIVVDDVKAIKILLILSALNFLFNNYGTINELSIMLHVGASAWTFYLILDLLSLLYGIGSPLLFLFYWPGMKQPPKGDEAVNRIEVEK